MSNVSKTEAPKPVPAEDHNPKDAVENKENHKNGEMKTGWGITLVTCLAFFFAIVVPLGTAVRFQSLDPWLYSYSPWATFGKVLTSLSAMWLCGFSIVWGITRIQTSEKGNHEWNGCTKLLVGGIGFGILLLMFIASADTYALVRRFFIPSQEPLMAMGGIENFKFDPTTQEAEWTMSGKPLWTVINIDFFDNDPVPRRSFVLNQPRTKDVKVDEKNTKTVFSYILPEQFRGKKVKRAGIYYATASGPCAEDFLEFETPPKK